MLNKALKRVTTHTRVSVLLIAAAWVLPLALFALVLHRANSVRDESAREVTASAEVPFTAHSVSLTAPSGIESIPAAPGYQDIAVFHNSVLVSAAAGLYLYDSGGTVLRTWRTGLELPPCEPGAMSAGTSEVFIATRGAGLLAFDGSGLRQVLPNDPALRNIAAVLALSSGRVIFGTERNGALVYDGRGIAPLTDGLKTAHVTALAGTEGDVWIGTLQHGVFCWHGGRLDDLSSALPDPQVLAIDVAGHIAHVGTPLGVVEFQDGQRTRTLADGVFARAISGSSIGTEDEGIIELRSGAAPRPAAASQAASPITSAIRSIREFSGVRYAATSSSVYRFDAARGWREALASPAAALIARNIAALGVSGGSLWVGYFDSGMDILPPDLSRADHHEDDTLFCINRIATDPSGQRTAVATANGLVLFDASGRRRQILGRKDGLLADHVTDVAFRNDGMVVATPAGLSFVDSAGIRSLYVLEGLVNNHVYALASAGNETIAGTLGGVSILDKDVIRANYTTANSGLRHNWVTAVARVGDDWFAGTYGAGVLRFGHDGQWTAFPDLKSGFIVNPNAMLVTAGRVYAGSLGRGLFVFDRASQRWTNVTRGLPSLNVTAFAESGGFLYIGTDNGLVRVSEEALP
jgi:ligand-binding sensor domain-containing protein